MGQLFIEKEDSIFSQCKKCKKFAKGKIWKAEAFFPPVNGITPKLEYTICERCAETKEEASEIIEIFLKEDEIDFYEKFKNMERKHV